MKQGVRHSEPPIPPKKHMLSVTAGNPTVSFLMKVLNRVVSVF